MKRAIIVSYASVGRESYFKRQLGLVKSIAENKMVDSYIVADGGYCDEYLGITIDLEFPKTDKIFHRHSEIPYQFKLAMIEKAIELGYTKIFYADSVFHLVKDKDITELLDQSEDGIVAFDNLGHPLYKYISDTAVGNLGVHQDFLKEIPQCFGGFFGVDIEKPKAKEFLDELFRQSIIGSYKDGDSTREGFVAHRGDQAVMSVVLWKMGVKLLPYGTIVYGNHCLPPYEFGKDFYGYFF